MGDVIENYDAASTGRDLFPVDPGMTHCRQQSRTKDRFGNDEGPATLSFQLANSHGLPFNTLCNRCRLLGETLTNVSPTPIVAIVPVKSPAIGKSRLQGIPETTRRALAAAFALDTADAVLRTRNVLAVLAITDDFRFAADLRELNAVLQQAAAESARRWPGSRPMTICADLPSLRSVDLSEMIDLLPMTSAAFVSDVTGLGTTIYAASMEDFDPQFGADSGMAHRAAGAQELPANKSLRRDVDTIEDLRDAMTLGVGHRTRALLDALDSEMTRGADRTARPTR